MAIAFWTSTSQTSSFLCSCSICLQMEGFRLSRNYLLGSGKSSRPHWELPWCQTPKRLIGVVSSERPNLKLLCSGIKNLSFVCYKYRQQKFKSFRGFDRETSWIWARVLELDCRVSVYTESTKRWYFCRETKRQKVCNFCQWSRRYQNDLHTTAENDSSQYAISPYRGLGTRP